MSLINFTQGEEAKASEVNDNFDTLREYLFGNGSDGSVTISSDITLTEDKNYTDLIINSGITVDTNGYIIKVSGTLTNNGTIQNNGSNGQDGADGVDGGNGGNAGVAHSSASLAINVGGGGGGGAAGGSTGGSGGRFGEDGEDGEDADGGQGAGGNGYYKTVMGFIIQMDTSNLHPYGIEPLLETRVPASPVTGGDGGYANVSRAGSGGGGGGAGASGGIILIGASTIDNQGTIQANGGDGGNGGVCADVDGDDGDGGDGGNGGVVALVYETLIEGTVNISGGSGGTGKNSGANGSAGKIIKAQI